MESAQSENMNSGPKGPEARSETGQESSSEVRNESEILEFIENEDQGLQSELSNQEEATSQILDKSESESGGETLNHRKARDEARSALTENAKKARVLVDHAHQEAEAILAGEGEAGEGANEQTKSENESAERREGELRLVERAQEASDELAEAIASSFPERAGIEKELSQKERQLAGEIKKMEKLSEGSNDPLIIKLEGGLKAIYKPTSHEMEELRNGIEAGQFAAREWLASQIDRALQLDVVPTTILRDGPKGVGSVQEWEKGSKAWDVPEWETSANQSDLERMALFDALTRNTDRHDANFVIEPGGKTHAVDNGLVFSNSSEDLLRSEVLKPNLFGGKPLSQENQSLLQKFTSSPDVQNAWQHSFDVAFGTGEGSKHFTAFKSKSEKYSKQEEVLPVTER